MASCGGSMGIKLTVGIVLAALMGAVLTGFTDLSSPAIWTAVITTLVASWWVMEPMPIAATSLIPFAAFPLVGVATHKEVASAYGHHLILLLLGGFILSKAVETVGAHRRIAFGMVSLTGGRGPNLVLGFMLASAVCSMWISNTATTLMLLPVAMAVLQHSKDQRLAVPLLLGIAYAASIGGVGTPIGTPPNVYFMSFFEDETGVEYGFLRWMKIGLPVVIIMLPLAWLWLTRGLRFGNEGDDTVDSAVVLPKLGPWTSAEIRVLVIFGCAAAAWIFRTEPFGGWTELIKAPGAGDSTVALAAVVALFLVPDNKGDPLIRWKDAESIPWGLLLLFGGGIAIAQAFRGSGLALAVGELLAGVASYPLPLVILVICLAVTFMTEVMSNTATTTLLMPLLFAAAAAAGVLPERLLIPAALSASCAFMLPVATAPNAIVFGTGAVNSRRMLREGVVLNFVGVAVISVCCLIFL
jgi:sodium-dependent dicarboxylate transporter 2/3/5